MSFGEFIVALPTHIPNFCESLMINREYLGMDPIDQCQYILINLHRHSFTLGESGWIDDEDYLYMLYLNVVNMKERINTIFEEYI